MRLLTDSVETSEEISCNTNNNHSSCGQPFNSNSNLKTFKSIESFSSDDSSINSCSSSPTDYMLDMIQGNSIQPFSMLKDFYDPCQQPILSDFINFDPLLFTADPFFGSVTIPNNTSNTTTTTAAATTTTTETKSCEFPFWPSYICLYLEYALPCDPYRPMTYNLAHMPQCLPSALNTVSLDSISKEKCPPLASLSSTIVALLAKVKLDLGLEVSDFTFNNTSFFETSERKTMECTTTIYSFGNVVLESKESQQALWVNEGKYMYNFVFVNQFFDAFMKGIRSLQSWEEVDIAINNLCIVQSFEDVELKLTNETTVQPSLIMAYEFERGPATIEIAAIDNIIVNEKFNQGLEFLGELLK
ncbi:hypothetical protein G6F62_008159 [Rhizopus arrhizus]|nr:hypothetical protein G6F62_008159 [Rhizopus arrhizus]